MRYWIVPSNDRTFRLGDAIAAQDGLTDWRTDKFSVGDIVFIYKPKPEQCIRYKMEVIRTMIPYDQCLDQEAYWTDKDLYYNGMFSVCARFRFIEEYPNDAFTLQKLNAHGCKGVPQSVRECKDEKLLKFLLESIKDEDKEIYEVDYSEDDKALYEGALIRVMANKYERNQKARRECVEKKGYKCEVCGLDFEETYGEKGRDFIHVHHVVPISSIGKEYKLNIDTDLVPVCPNCHYMLHRKDPPYTVKQLRDYLIEQNFGSPVMAAEREEGFGQKTDLLVGVVKPDRIESFKNNEARLYYFGRSFPSKYNLKQIRYFAPYYEGGIRGYYDVKAVRTARKSEFADTDDGTNNDVRIVLDLGSYHRMLDEPNKVHLASYTYAFLSLNDAFEQSL